MDQSWSPQAALPPPVPTPKPLPRWAPAAAALALALLFGVAGFFVGRSSALPDLPIPGAQASLEGAYSQCQPQDEDDTLELADNGATIIVDTGSEYGSTAGMDCVLDELGTPQSILAQLGNTTAMMGTQQADHDGVHYSWSYHPDNGVNMVITRGEN
jgi:hypothetical protein